MKAANGPRMSTTSWLRISAVIALLFAAGHTLGGFTDWSPIGDNPVLVAMRTVHLDTMGAHRSYLDFYRGFGYALSVSQCLIATLIMAYRKAGVPLTP